MSVLATLTWGRCAKQVIAALTAAGVRDGKVVVLGAPGLARVLAQRGREVVVDLPAADDDASGLVAVGYAAPDPAWLRAVRDGGALVLVASEPSVELSRAALCAGLTDLAAARTGRQTVMSGRVWKPRYAPGA